MFTRLLLGLAACSSLISAVPISHDHTEVSRFIASRAAVDNCTGYAASNIVETDSSLTADLTLAGAACNLYSEDIKDLKLVVEYQTSECFRVYCSYSFRALAIHRVSLCK